MRIRLSLIGGTPGDFVFGAEGGTFGRSMKCQWVLPDEERILSAIHGRVTFENNKFMLIDESTNGIFLDGRQQPIGRGNGVALVSGLRFRAARHLIEAQILPAQNVNTFAAPAAPSMPLTQGYQPAWQGGTPSAEQALRERSDMGDMWAKNSQDPLVYLGGAPMAEHTRLGPGAAPTVNAFSPGVSHAAGNVDSLFAPPQPTHDPFAGLGLNGHSQPAASQIPANFMPMHAPLGLPAAAPTPAGFQPQLLQPQPFQQQPSPPQSLIPQPPSPQPSMMQSGSLFPHPEQLQPVPNAAIPHAAPAFQPTLQPAPMSVEPSRKLIPDDFDPLSILAAPIKRPAEPQQNIGGNPPFPAQLPTMPAGSFAAQPAMPNPTTPIPTAPMPPLPTAPSREALSPSLMADIARIGEPAASRTPIPELASGDFDAIAAMKARREERKAKLVAKAGGDAGQLYPSAAALMPLPTAPATAMPLSPAPLMPQIATAIPPLTVQAPAQNPMPVVLPATGSDNAALIALFAGMGLQGTDMAANRQEQVIRDVGEMVRAFSEGLILLLSARRMVKSEFRMDETQIQPEENNPFKHFKMAELALDELFVTRSGGFQAPAEAAGSALEDLKQHVMMTMSAMQRAIKLLMERLSPENVAHDHETEGTNRIRGLVSRKGKWETYVETHQRMSGNFDGIARQLIAEAFAQVQEEQARRVASQYWEKKK